VLPVFHSGTSTPTIYVSARDRCLRKSPNSDSPRLPTFHHATESRARFKRLNVFLVILNAEIKFHRYLHMISQDPPTTPLPADVLDLMHLTVELVDLLYWNPVPTKGSQGEVEFAKIMKYCQRSPPRTTSPGTMKTIERGSSEERGKYGLPADLDLEARKAYGRALMSGHGVLSSLSSSQIQSTE
jgi:hypothetical protein